MDFASNELRYLEQLATRINALREYVLQSSQPSGCDLSDWLSYLAGLKSIQGNSSNDISSIACLLAKKFLMGRGDVLDYDCLAKPQGAAGADVGAMTKDGLRIHGEVKTTSPYQSADFGAAQRTQLVKDLDCLGRSTAEIKYLFVTDRRAFDVLKARYGSRLGNATLVLLPQGESFNNERWESGESS